MFYGDHSSQGKSKNVNNANDGGIVDHPPHSRTTVSPKHYNLKIIMIPCLSTLSYQSAVLGSIFAFV